MSNIIVVNVGCKCQLHIQGGSLLAINGVITPISRVFFTPVTYIYKAIYRGYSRTPLVTIGSGPVAGHNYLDLGTSIHTWDDYASPRPGLKHRSSPCWFVGGLVLAIKHT